MKKTLVTALSLVLMTMTAFGPAFGQESLKAAVAMDYDDAGLYPQIRV